jgi:hypothetical protein
VEAVYRIYPDALPPRSITRVLLEFAGKTTVLATGKLSFHVEAIALTILFTPVRNISISYVVPE